MITPPPDKQPAAETLEEIAERITAEVAKICGCAWESCTRTRTETKTAILSALRNERERCAKIATSKAIPLRQAAVSYKEKSHRTMETNCYWAATMCDEIAAAIREGK